MTAASSSTSRLRREAAVRAVSALLRWLDHHPTPAPEPIYLIIALKRTPVRRFEHRLRLPHSPFPSISLVSDRLPESLPDDIDPLPSAALRSLPAAARRGLVLVDRRIRVPSGKAASKGARPVPVDLADPAWAESAREEARCVELRVEGGTCRAVRVGHAAMTLEEAVENVVAAVEAAGACVPKKWKNVRALHVKSPESVALPLYSAPGTGGDGDAEDAKQESGAAAGEEQGKAKRRKNHPEYKKLQDGPPPYYDLLQQCYHDIAVDGSTAYVLGQTTEEESDEDDDDALQPDVGAQESPRSSGSHKRASSGSTTRGPEAQLCTCGRIWQTTALKTKKRGPICCNSNSSSKAIPAAITNA